MVNEFLKKIDILELDLPKNHSSNAKIHIRFNYIISFALVHFTDKLSFGIFKAIRNWDIDVEEKQN